MGRRLIFAAIVFLALTTFTGYQNLVRADKDADETPVAEPDIGKFSEGSRTDDETVTREEEAIKLDGLNASQMKQLREHAEKHTFQAEVSRMMKLIINSLYKNKEIFLRELISNASDALDKIRLLSLTDTTQLDATPEMTIKIKADKTNHILHVTDTGVGMTKQEMVNNLGTIAKSGTSEFISKMLETQASDSNDGPQQDLIGQFGVGFYSAFLVADRVVVTSKSNDDPDQWIWESDASSFNIMKDPRGNTLKRGTQITLHLKEESNDYLEPDTLKTLVKKYSQFINFNIELWTSKTESVEEPIEEEVKEETEEKKDEDDEAKIEDEKEEDKKPKTKKVEKTTWGWEVINSVKPLWTRKPADVNDDEYTEFYKSLTKDQTKPLSHIHFTAEGEVTFKSLLYVPAYNQKGFNEYGHKHENIKLFVRRVFITDDFKDMMPNYLSFIHGLVDSDDLPLNVSRETLQQNKLLKVIKKKLVRKVLDMFKKMDKETYEKFWKEYSTNIKLGVIEDSSNRTRLAKLLRFKTSAFEETTTSLSDYVSRMKQGQSEIYFMAGSSLDEVKKSPFVERILKNGIEVLYLTDPVDEYCMQSLPDFDGKRLQNVAKEGLKLDDSDKAKERQKSYEKEFKPLTEWLRESALKDQIEKAVVSERLHLSPCALVASSYGWSGNMERLMQSQAYAKSQDPMQNFYAGQKKTLELNPRHPLIKELLERVKTDKEDQEATRSARLLYETSVIRSGFALKDAQGFADRIEQMLRTSLHVPADAMVIDDEEPKPADSEPETKSDDTEKSVKESKTDDIPDEDSKKTDDDDLDLSVDKHDEHIEL